MLFNTDVYTGERLWQRIQKDMDKNRRFLVGQLEAYINDEDTEKVCLLYGLRRTGKTTMISHCLLNMSASDFDVSAYISLNSSDTVGKLRADLDSLYEKGFQYVFIDEITMLEDFISIANIYSDVYVKDGMKIVLTGTDSLGFIFAKGSTLYDRCEMIHTTFIPFYEFIHIFPEKNIDDYIEQGGTLIHEFDPSHPFYSGRSSNEYVDTAIAHNIQHSLECYEDGRYFAHLSELNDKDELTNVINRLVQRKNREFLLNIINRKFKSSDYGSAYQILESRLAKEHKKNPMDTLDKEKIRQHIMDKLDILEKKDRMIDVKQEALHQLNEYLQLLDLTQNYVVMFLGDTEKKEEHVLFNQTGLRYSQVKELYKVLDDDQDFRKLTFDEKKMILEIMDNDVKGNILEEMVLANTMYVLEQQRTYKELYPRYEVYQIVFQWNNKEKRNGEYDMVIIDNEKQDISVFEVKHSSNIVEEQTKHLLDEDKIHCLEEAFHAHVSNKIVIYLGSTIGLDDEVLYLNAMDFFKTLEKLDKNYELFIESGQEQGWCI